MKHELSVEYSAIFEDEPKNLSDYLKGIGRPFFLKAVTHFLRFKNNSKFSEPREFLEMFFCHENNMLANEIFSKLKALAEQHNNAKLRIINPISMLQLFEFAFDNLLDEDIQSNAEAEINIFKAILAINERNTKIQSSVSHHIDVLEPFKRLSALTLSQSFPNSEFENNDVFEAFTVQFLKSVFLFEFLESNLSTQHLLSRFLCNFKCFTWQDFLKKLTPIVFSIIKANNEGHIDIIIEKNEYFDDTCNLLDKLIVEDSEVIIDYDFRKIRSKPFYKVSEGVYRIIYSPFVIELLHKGLFFKLSEINRTLPEEEKVKGNFRSYYCDEFSEKYLLYNLLRKIYNGRYIEFSGSEIKAQGFSAEPDYYIRKGNNLFLFESKDILINAEIKHTYDYSKYEPEFRKKLYYDISENGSIEKKAVLQLVKNIKRVLEKEFSFDSNYKVKSVYIYPIIVLHDTQFNVAGLNEMVNFWFKDELTNLKNQGLNIDRVRSVVVIDIGSLLYHQDLLSGRTLLLEDILDAYIKYTTFDFKRKYKNEVQAYYFAARTVEPFSHFLNNYTIKSKTRRIPKMLKDKGLTLFN